jgi:hypothetical protein
MKCCPATDCSLIPTLSQRRREGMSLTNLTGKYSSGSRKYHTKTADTLCEETVGRCDETVQE